jgi:tRNA threonylcarbamoyladenosine biosynthesis protein TsaE
MQFFSQSEAETVAFAGEFARQLVANDIVALFGDLGAGKTRFAKGIASALGYRGIVSSPTFTIVNEYIGAALAIYHFDLYRVKSLAELAPIGWDHYLSNGGICLVEWPDIVADMLPHPYWRIVLESSGEQSRRIDYHKVEGG